MRKILLLTTVFTLSFGAFAHNSPVYAAVPVKVVSDTPTKGFIKKLGELLDKSLKNQSEQLTTVATSGQVLNTKIGTATSQNSVATAQQSLQASSTMNNSGIAENNCSLMTTSSGIGKGAGQSNATFKENMQADMAEINNEGMFANGVTDGNRQLFAERESLCSASTDGGAYSDICNGDGSNDHLSMASIFDPSINPDNEPKISYLKKASVAANTTYKIPPALLKNPSTDIQNIVIKSDRIKIINSLALTIINDVASKNTASPTASKAAKYLEDILKEADFLPEEFRNELINGKKISYMGSLEALAFAHMNPNLFKEKGFAGSVKAYLASMVFLKGFNNLIQVEQLKIAQKEAVATGMNALLLSQEMTEKLNKRISKARSGR